MGDNLSAINFFRQADAFGLNGSPIVENKPASEHQIKNSTEGAPLDLISNRMWQAALTRRIVEAKFHTQQAAEGELNGLSERRPINISVQPQDTQADVLRRAYQTYATTAGLNEENKKAFVKTMMDNGDNFIHLRGSNQIFTAEEFRVFKQRGQIAMYPTAEQIAELCRLKAEESEAIKVQSKAYAEASEITFQDTAKATQNYAVVRRYLQQNLLGADFYFVAHGDEATQRALELSVKPEVEEAGKTETGETLYRVKITPEDAERLQQVKAEYEARRAQFTEKMAQARSETNQMFADQGRVLWNSAVNIVEGTVNTAIDAALTNGGSNPLPLLNPYRPQADFSGAKTTYRSEMMRRDTHGIVDGNGIKAGQAIESGVTIVAPSVIGAATAPKASPQTLRSIGALPEIEASSGISASTAPSRIYRVQGGVSPKASKFRIFIGEKGEMVVSDKNKEALFVTFDDLGRVKLYQAKNRIGSEIISFDVDPKFVKQVRQAAVYEKDVRQFPDSPIIADPTKTDNSFGLPPDWIEKLIQASRQGTGKIER